MKLIFDWCDSFGEKKSIWRKDEQMISMEISQKECGFAVAKVVIFTKHSNSYIKKRYAKIGVQFADGRTEVLFSGRVVAFPSGFGSSSTEIELISEPSDYHQQLSDFCEKSMNTYKQQDVQSQENYQFDDLFFSNDDLRNPTAFLEADNKLFYWNMKNGRLSLSDIHHGMETININGNEILQNSLKVRLSREPYKSVNVTISASWLQYESGYIDLLSMIAPHFDEGKINSFTNIKPALENLCKFHERSGYTLLFKDVYETNPSGITGQYPLISPEFSVQGKKVRFKRFYFDGQLICGWQYKQKRTEHVSVRIVNDYAETGREKTLRFKLNALQLPKKYPTWQAYSYYENCDKVIFWGKVYRCTENHVSEQRFDVTKWTFIENVPDALPNDACRSFFSTIRGKNAIKYAIKRAIALMNYSQRYVEIDFCVNAEKYLLDATLANCVKISDARFQNGYIVGKIIKTKFIANAEHRLLKITIGCQSDAISQDVFEKLKELSIEIAEDKTPILPSDIVKNVEIQNTPAEQLAVIGNADVNNIYELKDVLNKHATKIKLTLHPQNTVREIVSEINLPDFTIQKEEK